MEVDGRTLLEGASFTVRAGDKVGLVGRNGAGKTTMLRTIAGQRPSAAGTVHWTGALGYLPQDPRIDAVDPGTTAAAHVLSGRGLSELAEHIEKLRLRVDEDASDRNITRFARAEETYRAAGGYAADAEVRRLLAGLGLAADRADLPIGVLSGGERRRVELARILFAGSDLLFLDEPTNHLDIDARTWLLGFLRTYRGALLVISHDLELLDDALTRVLHLDDGTLVSYKGTYSQYQRSRAEDEARLTKVVAREQAEIKRLSTLADSMRGQTAKRARTAKTLDHRVDRLQANASTGPKAQRVAAVRFPEPPRSGRVTVEVEGLAKGYGRGPVFEDVSFAVERGERLLVLGLNGAGKTSLLRVLAGRITPDAGTVVFGHNVSPGYYAQEHEGIQAGVEVLRHLQDTAPATIGELRGLLGMFGLAGEQAFQDAGTLSGGEKTKVALAQLVAGAHNLLLLDEPTNNLDPPSRDAVAAALAGWPGSMIIVSHDTSFVEALQPQKALVLPDGTLDWWSDDLLDLVALA